MSPIREGDPANIKLMGYSDFERDPNSVCVRDGLAGWGGWIRTPAY